MIRIFDGKRTGERKFPMGGPKRAALFLAAALVLTACGQNGGTGSADSGTTAAGEAEEIPESTVSDGVADSAEEGAASDVQAADETPQAAADGVSPQEIYTSVGGAVELPSMIEGDDDFIFNYYGIDPATLDGYVFASAEDATLADSVIILKVKSADVLSDMEAALNTVKDQKAAEMEDYIPEQYEIVADSSVKTEGLYVYLVISEKAGEIEAVIQEALK